MLAAGCVTIKTRRAVKKEEIHPQLTASEEQILARYGEQARAVQSLQATVDLVPSTGSTYSGVIEDYHDVPGFILAQRPEMVRIIGQAPVVAKNIFDMVSDGQQFRIYIPSKNTFLVGATSLMRPSKKPIENLRPQHIVEALFWPEITATTTILFEQFNADSNRYYVMTVLRTVNGGKLEIDRKIWFDRSDLHLSRLQIYGPAGELDSDIAYSDWEPLGAALAAGAQPAMAASSAPNVARYPRDIQIWRPQDDYKLEIHITKLTVNEPISADRFEFPQPPGTELVHVGEEPTGAQP
jgi:outer membrane lipoprotein-sorting protein